MTKLEWNYRINEQYSKIDRATIDTNLLAASSCTQPYGNNPTSTALKRLS